MPLTHSKFGLLLNEISKEESERYLQVIDEIAKVVDSSTGKLRDMLENLDNFNAETLPESDLHRMVVKEFLDVFEFGEEKIKAYREKLQEKINS